MPAAGSNGFEGRKIAKLVGLLDSPQDAEAAGALHRIRVNLKKHGLTFYQAVEDHEYKTGIWEAFGQPDCLREYFERKQNSGNETQLREEIARLQTALGERERGGARLAEALDAVQHEFEEYRRKAEEHRQTPPPSGGLVNGGSVFIVTMLAIGLALASAFYHDARQLVVRVSVEVKKGASKAGKARVAKTDERTPAIRKFVLCTTANGGRAECSKPSEGMLRFAICETPDGNPVDCPMGSTAPDEKKRPAPAHR